MSLSKNKTPTTETRLLPFDFKNEQFQLNLDAFKSYHPELEKKISQHIPINFQICLNPDDSINVYKKSEQLLLYPIIAKECQQYFETIVNSINFIVKPYTVHTYATPLSKQLTEALPLNAALHNKLLESNHFLTKVDDSKDKLTINKKNWNFIPLLRVYGIGLGHHILLALQKYDVATLIIHEPDFDLFYTSLYTTPWNVILETLNNDPHRQYFLNIDNPSSGIASEINFLANNHPFYANFKAEIYGSLERDFNDLANHEKQYDSNHCLEVAGGCYEDQMVGLINAIQNIKKHSVIYNGKAIKTDIPIFLIGSGPSLDQSINYLAQHKDKIIIIACGSAISILIKNNITPDFHVLQERFIGSELLLKYASAEIYKEIICIKLNVVNADIDRLYKKSFVLQKANDPGSSLLPSDVYPHSYNVNPTVTNTGVVLCDVLGAKKVYLLGLDYGSSETNSTMHSKDVFMLENDSIVKKNLMIIDGNNDQKVYTNEYFLYSKEITEHVIKHSKKTQWFNVGEGAKIANTHFISPLQLPNSFKPSHTKAHVLDSIHILFNNDYSTQAVLNTLNETHISASYEYLVSLLELFDTIPQTRRAMMTTFSLIIKATQIGATEDSYLPKKLFSLEFISFLNNLYVLICVSQSEEEAITVYKNSVAILKQHIEIVYQDFISAIASSNISDAVI